MTGAHQLTRPVTTRLRAISITVGTIVLAVGLPIILAVILFQYNYDGPFTSDALDWFVSFVLFFVLPDILGATFWWASWRLRQRPFVWVFAEASCLALAFLIAGPLLAAMSQALSASIFGNQFAYLPFLNDTPPPLAAQTDLFTNAWNVSWKYVTGWLPISLSPTRVLQVPMVGILPILALGEGALGSGLASFLARWASVRTKLSLTSQVADWREAARVLGVIVILLFGINACFGLPHWPRITISNPATLIILLSLVLLVPTFIPCLIACAQTLALLRTPPSALLAPASVESDDQVVFSIEQIPERL